jgi:hypothetical protein
MEATSALRSPQEQLLKDFGRHFISQLEQAGLSGCDVISADGTRLNVTLSDGYLKATVTAGAEDDGDSAADIIGRCVATLQLWDQEECDTGENVLLPKVFERIFHFYELLGAVKTCACEKAVVYTLWNADGDDWAGEDASCSACHFAKTRQSLKRTDYCERLK